MRFPFIAASVLVLTSGCATGPQASLEDRTLAYGCNDIVVVGSVENHAYQAVTSDDDILGHGWVSASVRVRKVIKGARVPSVLPVRYFAHTYMRQHRDFMLVIEQTGDGRQITTGQLMSLRPLLASGCK